jgi:hypothetical protein
MTPRKHWPQWLRNADTVGAVVEVHGSSIVWLDGVWRDGVWRGGDRSSLR